MKLWKSWRSAAVAVFAAFAVLVTATQASAAVPGEDPNWHPDGINGGQAQYTAGTPAEARNGNNLIQVWRSNDNQGAIWYAINNGPAQRFTGQTFDSPVVVPYGTNGFAVFHTGNDNHIYYTFSFDGRTFNYPWFSVPNQTTPYTVSVTQLGAGSTELYMAYRANGGTNVWGTMFNGVWRAPQNMGGSTYHSPAVTFNPVSHRIYAAVAGTDNRLYLNYQQYGQSNWNAWVNQGGGLAGYPSIAALPNGNMQVAILDWDDHVWYREFNNAGYPLYDWSQDSNPNRAAARTGWPVFLITVGGVIYTLMTLLDNHQVYYKQSYNGSF